MGIDRGCVWASGKEGESLCPFFDDSTKVRYGPSEIERRGLWLCPRPGQRAWAKSSPASSPLARTAAIRRLQKHVLALDDVLATREIVLRAKALSTEACC